VEAVMLLRFVFLAVLFAHFLLPPCSWAVSLTFDDVLARAVEHSPDLAIAKYDVAAKRGAVNERAYDYVPTVELRSYAEQYKDMTQGAAAVNSVGDVVYSSNSQAQVSHYVTAQLTLWDFGVRGKRMDYAKADVRSSMAQGDRVLIDLKLAVLDEYAAAQACGHGNPPAERNAAASGGNTHHPCPNP
jgi:outer membrane protein TolC